MSCYHARSIPVYPFCPGVAAGDGRARYVPMGHQASKSMYNGTIDTVIGALYLGGAVSPG